MKIEIMEKNYNEEQFPNGVPIKMWTKGVPVEDDAKTQLANASRLPIVFKHIAAMPDVHLGIGATVGSVIPTLRAIIPAAVGVDIGCGMIACKTTLCANDLPDNLAPLRDAIEKAVPHGRTVMRGARDKGSWDTPPPESDAAWAGLVPEFDAICQDYPVLKNTNNRKHLGTLGTGNHFVEVCLDEVAAMWFMLHSGSRGVGNAIGSLFIELAKKDALANNMNLPDKDLAYFEEGIRTPPVLLNGYDRPIPDGRGFSPIGGERFKFGGPWVKPALDRANVDSDLGYRSKVIGYYIEALNEAMQHLASRTTGVYCPPALGTLRTSPTTYKQDWDNELHPTASGFTQLARGPWLTQLAALGFTVP